MGVSLREYQLFQLTILKEFKRICDAHHLTWWMAYGSLLGAARHKGFIPWDDDIDVVMMPHDYRAFRDICRTELSNDYYLQVHALNPANHISWQRIGVKQSTSLPQDRRDVPGEWGVCIDIFPLVSCPDPSTPAFEDFLKRLRAFDRASAKYIYAHDARITTGLRKMYNLWQSRRSDADDIARWCALEEELLFDSPWKTSAFVADIACIEASDSYEKAWFDHTIELPFEDITVPVPQGYDCVLSRYYGENWAEIPDESSGLRWAHSGGGNDEVIVSLTEPYTQYLTVPPYQATHSEPAD